MLYGGKTVLDIPFFLLLSSTKTCSFFYCFLPIFISFFPNFCSSLSPPKFQTDFLISQLKKEKRKEKKEENFFERLKFFEEEKEEEKWRSLGKERTRKKGKENWKKVNSKIHFQFTCRIFPLYFSFFHLSQLKVCNSFNKQKRGKICLLLVILEIKLSFIIEEKKIMTREEERERGKRYREHRTLERFPANKLMTHSLKDVHNSCYLGTTKYRNPIFLLAL